jgi:flagellar motor switch protein FliN/FliY
MAADSEHSQTAVNSTEMTGETPTSVEASRAGNPPHAFSSVKGQHGDTQPAKLDFILDIPLEITVELGRTKMLIHDLLKLGQGSVIELGKPAGETLEILANNRLIAKGDVVVMNDKYGIRLTEVISTIERLEKLK